MEITVKEYTKDRLEDVLAFEAELRKEEDFWGWDIDDKYISDVTKSFSDPAFHDSISLLAYEEDRVVYARV